MTTHEKEQTDKDFNFAMQVLSYFAGCNPSERTQKAYTAVCRATEWCIAIDTSESSDELLEALEIRNRLVTIWHHAMELSASC